jgi:lysophospholipase L1-like esterase
MMIKIKTRECWLVTVAFLTITIFSNFTGFISSAAASPIMAVAPQLSSSYLSFAVTSEKPMLTWSVVPGAVSYEVEFLREIPENPRGIEPSRYRISVASSFTNGYNADLSLLTENHLYWRVRALNYDRKPIGTYSEVAALRLDHSRKVVLKPLLNAVFNQDGRATPLYPAYAWIGVRGAVQHEVEITSQAPENPNGIEPSRYRIWAKKVDSSFDCYDEEARITPGTYYWRVRGIGANGEPVGVYSNAGQFKVDWSKGAYAATFGDSITHGGGGVSYPPCSWDYSYQTYLAFPNVNLGHSGDTSEAMVARFEEDVLPFHPRFLIILGGSNSLRGGIPAEKVIADLENIRDKCIANAIRPIFLTLPPINPASIHKVFGEDTVEDWRQEFDTVNAFIREQQYYIDIEPFLCDDQRQLPVQYGVDGLHPDAVAKKIMARVINANWRRVSR